MIEAPCKNGNVVKTQTTIIPESDIYRLIIKSKLPEAEKFENRGEIKQKEQGMLKLMML